MEPDRIAAVLGIEGLPDRRRRPREAVHLDARIVSDDLWCAIDCVIVDRSPVGARLRLPWPLVLPDRFGLEIPSEQRTIRARCVWRRGEAVGVEFVGGS